jgi:hypothetical protein
MDMDENEKDLEVRVKEWEEFIRLDVKNLLDVYLPISDQAASNITYSHPIKHRYEGNIVYDKEKATGVQLNIFLKFEEPIDVSKEDEQL